MSYEFGSTLYRTQAEMLDAIASEWLTAGGTNTAADIAGFLAGTTDEALAAECISGWGLDQGDDRDDRPDHMADNGYTAADLAAAFARYRAAQARPIYEAYRYAADGQAGEEGDGAVIATGPLDECRAAIRRAIGAYFDDPTCRWAGTSAEDYGALGQDDMEAYHESTAIGCGGYAIRAARNA